MKIAFIGGGNMAEAILSVILDKGVVTRGSALVSDIQKDRNTTNLEIDNDLKSLRGNVFAVSNNKKKGKYLFEIIKFKKQPLINQYLLKVFQIDYLYIH